MKNTFFKSDTLQGSANKIRERDGCFAFKQEFELSIDAHQDIVNYEFIDGKMDETKGQIIAVLTIEADEQTTTNKKKQKRKFL